MSHFISLRGSSRGELSEYEEANTKQIVLVALPFHLSSQEKKRTTRELVIKELKMRF